MNSNNKPYSDYFSVDEGYYPEINPNSIKDPKNDWFKTFPHPTFIKLLEKVEKMMARETTGKRHSIWVQGAFGTGKSHVIWAIQQLMTCSEEKFCAYFDEYPALKKKTDLRDKLLGHRRGKVVTAFRYASGDIDSNRKLIMAVYASVTEALMRGGYQYRGEHALRGRIAAWLSDEGNQQIFQIIIDKPKYRGLGSFAGKKPSDILSQLQGSVDADSLINDILTVSENERVGVYDLSVEDLKAWLTDVIDENQLTSLLFLWDEFSSFFRKNKHSLDIFQSLLELCAEKPFEMIIVTHMAGSIAIDEQVATVSDRFEQIKIELPDNVAFDLIGHAMKPAEAAREAWEDIAADLASRPPEAQKAVANAVNVPGKVLQDMIPIHPMAALMLKYISENFASNQRSMFNFIKNEDSDDLQAFQWFIRTHGPESGALLTIDYLWNFFYEKGTDEHGAGAGRSNLDTIIAGILDTYPQNEKRLKQDQRRVLKVVLMMQAVSRKLNNAVPLLRPTEKNIRLAFEGDETFTNAPHLILKNQLVDQLKILFTSPIENNVVEYSTATVQGDQFKIDEIIERFKKEAKTAKLIKDAELIREIRWTPAVNMRFVFTPVCAENFTIELSKLVNLPEDYHIYGLLCFARNEEEQMQIRDLITAARKEDAKRRVVIIDASGMSMGNDNFAEWAKYAANEEYWRTKDPTLANNHKSHVDDQLAAWRDAVSSGTFLVYYANVVEKEPCSAMQLNEEVLPRIVLDRYPLAFDNARVSESFFQSEGSKARFPDSAKRGIEQSCGGIFQDEYVLPMMKDVWHVPDYWTIPANASLPIVQLKKALDQHILSHFETDIRISQVDIYDFLLRRGFAPCNLYAFLTGFLLKEYAGEPYRYGIGESGEEGDTMDAKKLSEHIGECIKHYRAPINNYKEKYIEIMSVEQEAFVDFAAKAFDMETNLSVEKAATRMRSSLKSLRYPVWCYKKVDTHKLGDYINKIADIANDRGGDNVPSLATKLGKMLLDVHSASDNLIALLTKENGKKAMTLFLQDFREGQLIDLATEINAPHMLEDVRDALSSGEALWLWVQETGEEELDKLITEYRVVATSNHLAGHNTFEVSNTFASCMNAWRECARFTHIPATMLSEKNPEIKRWALLLAEIVSEGSLVSHEKKQSFLHELDEKQVEIATFLADRQMLFATYYASSLNGLDADGIKRVYLKLPDTSYTTSKSDFVKQVNACADQERATQMHNQLRKLWEEASGFNGPVKWSEHYMTPVLALVPTSEQDKARKLFAVLCGSYTNQSDIDIAMDYMKSSPAFLSSLQDSVKIDAAFEQALIGQYRTVISVTEARKELDERSSAEPYYWMEGRTAQDIIREKAETNYLSGANEPLMRRIDDMDASRAKEYLKDLVKNKLDVGIQIMAEEGV